MMSKELSNDIKNENHVSSMVTDTPVIKCSPGDKAAEDNNFKPIHSISTLPCVCNVISDEMVNTLDVDATESNDKAVGATNEILSENYFRVDATDNIIFGGNTSENAQATDKNVIKSTNSNSVLVNNKYIMSVNIEDHSEQHQDQHQITVRIPVKVEENSLDENHTTSNTNINHQEVPRWKLSNLLSSQKLNPGERHLTKNTENDQTLNQRPSVKILERLYSVTANDNTYVSLTGDSLYQSLNNGVEDTDEDHKDELIEDEHKDDLVLCPVLVASLVSSHAEAVNHTEMTRCQDCQQYAAGLDNIVQQIQMGPWGHINQV